jgi:hypothetical protein
LSFQTLLSSIHLSFVLWVCFIQGFVRTVRISFSFSFFQMVENEQHKKQLMGVFFFLQGRKEGKPLQILQQQQQKQ